jgi:hypothetical protein
VRRRQMTSEKASALVPHHGLLSSDFRYPTSDF